MPSSRPLSVLQLTAPGFAGGIESVVLDLAVGLQASGHRVVLVAVLDLGAPEPPLLLRAGLGGVEVRRVSVPARAYLQEYRVLSDLIRQAAPDVVHTHGYRADLIGGRAARVQRVPWVSTVHGFTGGDLKNRLYEWLQVRSYRKAQAAVAVSRPIRDRLLGSSVPPDRVHLVPNAWMPKGLAPREEARRRLGVSSEEPLIGWVGRLTPEKGPDVFLEALAQLPHRAWRASIVGDGVERPALELRAARLGIVDRITWHGMLPHAALLYSAFDAWVLSSRTEGTPIALFEAMAAGVPAVVTRVGGVPDVVSSTEAVLVPPEDPAALSVGIREVLDGGTEVAARASAAVRRLTEGFASAAWLDTHISLYRALTIGARR